MIDRLRSDGHRARQGRRDGREHGIERTAHCCQGADGCDRYQRRDEALFDGGGAGVVLHDVGQKFEFHNNLQ